jgi:glycosyltransferase involved in cell wall biosynthesis
MKHQSPITHRLDLPKVAFLIATCGHGRGGHFWDMKTIVEALRGRVECVPINIGPYKSPVIDSIPVKVHNIHFKGLNIAGAVRQVVDILKRERIDALNVFDTRIFCIADMASRIAKKPLLLTKCGGPNPGRFYPVVDYLVVFSKENLEYFQNHPKYANTEIRFLPNRATKAASDPARIEKLRARLGLRKKTFLIIARFCEHYKKNMMQGMNLVRRLNAEGRPSQLMIVGTPEEPAVMGEIAEYRDDGVIVVNDEEFTLDASELIDVADFVIAAGRGFMEAASRGKPLLTSLEDSPFPLLITEETFPAVFATNFSPRNRIENLDVEENHRKIARALEDDGYRTELSDLASRLFNEHFDVNSVVEEYEELFGAMRYKRRFRLMGLLYGIYSTLRCFAPFWLSFGRQE